MSLLSQINLERLDTNTIVKYFIDREDDSNSGFYLYAWSSISKQFIKTTQRADDPDYVKASLIYILDHHLPQAGENPASHHTVLLNSQTGDDHFVIEASLATSVVIEDSGGTGNLVQFASGFEAQTIIITPEPGVDLLIDFIDVNGNAQTLIIKDAARLAVFFGFGGFRGFLFRSFGLCGFGFRGFGRRGILFRGLRFGDHRHDLLLIGEKRPQAPRMDITDPRALGDHPLFHQFRHGGKGFRRINGVKDQAFITRHQLHRRFRLRPHAAVSRP